MKYNGEKHRKLKKAQGSLTDYVTFEQRPKGAEGAGCVAIWWENIPDKGTARAKFPRWEKVITVLFISSEVGIMPRTFPSILSHSLVYIYLEPSV